jgi:peptidoglycan hydrolase CwlO-like protein
VKLGEDISQKYKIMPENRKKLEIPAPQELLPQEQFDGDEPDFPDDGKSVSITFEWTSKPFTLPAGASRHQLYANWDSAQKNITERIDRILNDITENEKKEKTISNRIKHFFLGKQQKFKEYQNEMKSLRKITYGLLEKNDLQKKIEIINTISGNVIKDTDEIAEEDRKAQIQENIKAKEDKKTGLEKELAGKELEIAEVKSKRQSLSDNYYAKGYINKEASLPDFRKTLEKQLETAKKEQKNVFDDIQKKLDETKRTLKELDDMNAKHLRLGDGAEQLKNNIKKVSDEIKSLESQLHNSGEKKPEEPKKNSVLARIAGVKGTGNKAAGLSSKDGVLSVPQLDWLPSTGELFQHNGQKYLVIKYWEEYDKGKNEASRLHAELCAEGGK